MEEIIKIRVDINDIKENNTKKECCFFKKAYTYLIKENWEKIKEKKPLKG